MQKQIRQKNKLRCEVCGKLRSEEEMMRCFELGLEPRKHHMICVYCLRKIYKDELTDLKEKENEEKMKELIKKELVKEQYRRWFLTEEERQLLTEIEAWRMEDAKTQNKI